MKNIIGIILISFLAGSITGIATTIAIADQGILQMLRVEIEDVPVLDTVYPSKILAEVSSSLGKKIVIKPRENCKQPVYNYVRLASIGRMIHSDSFGIGSNINAIKKARGKPQSDVIVKNQGMLVYEGNSVVFKYAHDQKVTEVSQHSFFGSPSVPPLSRYKKELGRPYREYHLKQIIIEGKKRGINVIQKLHQKGFTKKIRNLEKAIDAGDFDITVVLYKFGKYYFYVTECRIYRDTKVYSSVGVRVNDNILEGSWIF